jgi:hypothetical protein
VSHSPSRPAAVTQCHPLCCVVSFSSVTSSLVRLLFSHYLSHLLFPLSSSPTSRICKHLSPTISLLSLQAKDLCSLSSRIEPNPRVIQTEGSSRSRQPKPLSLRFFSSLPTPPRARGRGSRDESRVLDITLHCL